MNSLVQSARERFFKGQAFLYRRGQKLTLGTNNALWPYNSKYHSPPLLHESSFKLNGESFVQHVEALASQSFTRSTLASSHLLGKRIFLNVGTQCHIDILKILLSQKKSRCIGSRRVSSPEVSDGELSPTSKRFRIPSRTKCLPFKRAIFIVHCSKTYARSLDTDPMELRITLFRTIIHRAEGTSGHGFGRIPEPAHFFTCGRHGKPFYRVNPVSCDTLVFPTPLIF